MSLPVTCVWYIVFYFFYISVTGAVVFLNELIIYLKRYHHITWCWTLIIECEPASVNIIDWLIDWLVFKALCLSAWPHDVRCRLIIECDVIAVCRDWSVPGHVSGWVAGIGHRHMFNSWCRKFNFKYRQPPRLTQPGHPFVSKHNEYLLKGCDALWLGSKGMYSLCLMAGKTLWYLV